MRDRLKLTYEVPKWTTPSQTALNQTRCSQTMACIIKSSCEIWALLVYYTVHNQNSLPTFCDNLLAPFSNIKKFKKENTA